MRITSRQDSNSSARTATRAAIGTAESVRTKREGFKVEIVPISSLKPHEKNYRSHPDDQIAHLVESLKRFGVYRNVVVARDGTILAGHGVVQSAQKARIERIPVVRLNVAADSASAIKVLVGDNEVTRLAESDDKMLAELLKHIQKNDDLLGTGFDDASLKEFCDEETSDAAVPEPRFDKAAALQKKWATKRGQLWEVGRHRLMCGDSTGDDVAKLFGEKKAWLLATDPPYGVGFGVTSGPDSAKRFAPIISDEDDGPSLQAFLERAFRRAVPFLNRGTAWYLWHAQMTQGFFAAAAAAAAAQVVVHRQIIWSKSHFILGHGDYHWQHELCFYGWREGEKHRWFGDHAQSTVWEIQNPRAHENHPTEKPPELFTRPMLFNTRPGEICYEPFSGSGSQICAAERCGRICYALEIEPKYVAVALERLAEMGLKPKLLKSAESTNRPPKR